MKLYSYWRSTAAYRVRIALNIKGLDYEYCPVHLVKNGGEQFSQEYKSINPQMLIPSLITENNEVITQSLAIIDYLDEKYPEKTLYPVNIAEKYRAKAIALSIACDIHPLNNLRVLKYLKEKSFQQNQVDDWYAHWIHQGFYKKKKQIEQTAGTFCFGEIVSVADIFLVAQVYNANRFNVPLDNFPNILRINSNCLKLDDFIRATPENQPDCDI